MGELTPTAMVPVTFSAKTGELMPGQNFGPELVRPGSSEANAMITTTGRYVVQKAELINLFYYYLFQGNYNFFNSNEVSYDDVSQEQMTMMTDLTSKFNVFKAVQRQLAEAGRRGEIDIQASAQLSEMATVAAGQCRGARKLLLAQQPLLPSETSLASVRRDTAACVASLKQSLLTL